MSKLATKIVIEIDDCQEIDDKFRDRLKEATFEENQQMIIDGATELMVEEAGATRESIKVKVYRCEIID